MICVGPLAEMLFRKENTSLLLMFHKKKIKVFGYYIGPVYTWRTLTGVKLNNNRTQYSRPEIFWHVTKALSRKYTKREVFRLCLFCEKLRFIYFAQRTSVKLINHNISEIYII